MKWTLNIKMKQKENYQFEDRYIFEKLEDPRDM